MECYRSKHSFVFILLLAMATTLVHGQGTRVGFYSKSCPRAESIVRTTVQSHFRSNPKIVADLLRMTFHDCFVHGCDASILIDGPSSEKTAPINGGLRGFEVIDDAKKKLEIVCPGVVSCADIIALVGRDSVVMSNGRSWAVPTGRRDGRVSRAIDVNVPHATDSVHTQKKKFAAKGLSAQDLVTLVGGHTIGSAACQLFSYRLANFSTATANGADPSMDPAFVHQLQALCPANGHGANRAALDTGSPNRFDISYFANLRRGRGVLQSDQRLWTDASTRKFVKQFLGVRGLHRLNFGVEFGKSMVKMSNIGVKTGTAGEIRRVCTAVN